MITVTYCSILITKRNISLAKDIIIRSYSRIGISNHVVNIPNDGIRGASNNIPASLQIIPTAVDMIDISIDII